MAASSPSFLLKVGHTPLLPAGFQVDLGRADDPLPVKASENPRDLVWSFWRSYSRSFVNNKENIRTIQRLGKRVSPEASFFACP